MCVSTSILLFFQDQRVLLTPTHRHTCGIKTSWEKQEPGQLDNLNQTNCLNASIRCHYVRQVLSAGGLKTRHCVCVRACVRAPLAGGCWAPRSTWLTLFCSGKSARLCQHWGSASTVPKTVVCLKGSKCAGYIHGFISFLLTQGLLQTCICAHTVYIRVSLHIVTEYEKSCNHGLPLHTCMPFHMGQQSGIRVSFHPEVQ